MSNTELRDAIQGIALRFPAYGRPRITAELKRQGWKANHKRVGRTLREDNDAKRGDEPMRARQRYRAS